MRQSSCFQETLPGDGEKYKYLITVHGDMGCNSACKKGTYLEPKQIREFHRKEVTGPGSISNGQMRKRRHSQATR